MSKKSCTTDEQLCGIGISKNNSVITKGALCVMAFAIVAFIAFLLSTAPVMGSEADDDDSVGLWYNDILYNLNDYTMTAYIETTCGTAPEITIPNTVTDPDTGKTYTVTSIGAYSFDNYPDLEVINFEEGCKIKTIDDSAFEAHSKLKYVDWHHLECLETIGMHAFNRCSNLSGELYIPSTVSTIREFAFSYCSSLTSLVFGDNSELTVITERAFNECSSLTGSIVLPDGIEYIQNGAFCYCCSVTSVSLSACTNLRIIEAGGFWDCLDLTDISFPVFEDFESISLNAFGFMAPGDDPHQSKFTNYLGGTTFIVPDVDSSKFEGFRYHRDSTGDTPFTRVCEVSIEGIGDSTVYAGTQLSEPQLTDRPNYVFNGWYWNNLYWSFENYVVVDDMTLTQKWSPIEEGTVVIDSRNSTTLEINLDGKQVDMVVAEFSNGNSITLYTSSSNVKIFISMYELSGNKVEIITEGYDGTITIALSVNYYKGTPNAYYYGDDGKILMDSILTMDGHIVFDTDHNSTYGVEYEKTANEGMSYGPIFLFVAMIIASLILAAAGTRR